jgi:hypothetical protein
MNKELLNILANSNKDIDNQKLMDYLSGKLSGEEKHEMEKLMADSDFMNDAVEGLQNMGDKKELMAYVAQLNKDLQSKLQQKKLHHKKRQIKEQPWTLLAIALVLILCFIAYFVIRKFIH